ncbi:MAG: hypothetical protein KIT69_21380, partial [Propionibacteriaceae bacterium]|nr:hypothetical protein [Propionibacteriaceae bacterium]
MLNWYDNINQINDITPVSSFEDNYYILVYDEITLKYSFICKDEIINHKNLVEIIDAKYKLFYKLSFCIDISQFDNFDQNDIINQVEVFLSKRFLNDVDLEFNKHNCYWKININNNTLQLIYNNKYCFKTYNDLKFYIDILSSESNIIFTINKYNYFDCIFITQNKAGNSAREILNYYEKFTITQYNNDRTKFYTLPDTYYVKINENK